jgi:hypothetical protein
MGQSPVWGDEKLWRLVVMVVCELHNTTKLDTSATLNLGSNPSTAKKKKKRFKELHIDVVPVLTLPIETIVNNCLQEGSVAFFIFTHLV